MVAGSTLFKSRSFILGLQQVNYYSGGRKLTFIHVVCIWCSHIERKDQVSSFVVLVLHFFSELCWGKAMVAYTTLNNGRKKKTAKG